MGSWYETCFVSHLPIREGEKCRLFFLEHNTGWRGDSVSAGFSHPSDVWVPCSFGLPGKYADFGRIGIKDSDCLEVRMAMEHVKKRLIEMPQEEEGRKNPPVLREGLTPIILQEAISEGRGKLKDLSGKIEPYGFVFLREDVYQATIKRGFLCTWRDKPKFDVARFVQQGLVLFEELKKLKAQKALETELYKQWMWHSDIEFLKYEGCEEEYDMQRYFSNSGMEFRDHLGARLIEMVKADSSDTSRFLQLVAEHYVFSSYLDAFRRAWMPQPGRGSQSEAYKDHIFLAKLVADIATREMNREEDCP